MWGTWGVPEQGSGKDAGLCPPARLGHLLTHSSLGTCLGHLNLVPAAHMTPWSGSSPTWPSAPGAKGFVWYVH